jgi:RHS repeat-associated protein
MSGYVIQEIHYAPFGEVISEYTPYWHGGKIPDYLFNGKELDEETGMYYYEARYYNPPMFISRDPLFEKKPFMSPYAYCRNNPLIFIDPNGEDEYEFDESGKYVQTIKNDKIASFHVVNTNGERIASTIDFDVKDVTHRTPTINGKRTDIFEIKGDANAKETFELMANHTNTEWSHAKIGLEGSEKNIVGTSHSNESTAIGNFLNTTGYTLRDVVHNHPSESPIPSGTATYDKSGKKTQDLHVAESYMKRNPSVNLNIYTKKYGYSPYNDKGTLDSRISKENGKYFIRP